MDGYFIENPMKMDDLGVPPFLETTMWAPRKDPILNQGIWGSMKR